MGYDLSGKGGVFHWSSRSWLNLLQLARRYGWQPAGTELEKEKLQTDPDLEGERTWSGSYFWIFGQRVTDGDAMNLALALEAALPDLPDQEPDHKLETRYYKSPEGQPIKSRGLKKGESLNLLEWFAGDAKEQVAEFIRFCKAGGFFING